MNNFDAAMRYLREIYDRLDYIIESNNLAEQFSYIYDIVRHADHAAMQVMTNVICPCDCPLPDIQILSKGNVTHIHCYICKSTFQVVKT